MATAIPRMSLHLRVQHGLLALCVGAALATGIARGSGAAGLERWHLLAGGGALLLLVHHLGYLAVRGYVEGRGWAAFPLRWDRGDWAEASGDLRFVLGRGPGRPEAGEYRASQKALYWWTAGSLAAIGATGIAVGFWERLGGAGALGSLPTLAAAHRGFALLLLTTVLWHVYGALVWEGRWSPDWSWVTGLLDAELARRRVPGALRRHLEAEAEQAAAPREVEPDERLRERLAQEKEDVEAALEAGNRLALEERYVEALFHYRRALELYPGYSQARYNMARVLARMGEQEMAIEAYRQFLEHDPFHPLAGKAQEAVRALQGGERR